MEETPELKRIKQLEKENAKLKEQLSNQTTAQVKRGWWFTKTIGNWFMGGTLRKALSQSIDELKTDGKLSQKTGVHLGASIFERFTRIGLFAILAALIPVLLLFTQTYILYMQTELLSKQYESDNFRFEYQASLEELNNRKSLFTIQLNDLMILIDTELKEDYGNDGIRNLSPQLTGRIIELSTRLEPYYMHGDSLIDKPLSPERGQLLVSLLESQLDTTALDKIYEKADFSYADLAGYILDDAYISGATLDYANLSRAILGNADLSEARLINANLSDADLWNADMEGARLENAYLSDANLWIADLRLAKLEYADMSNTNLRSTKLNEAYVEKNWFEILEKNNVDGVDFLKEKYEIVKYDTATVPFYRLQLKTEE